jgi:hypothetical protein
VFLCIALFTLLLFSQTIKKCKIIIHRRISPLTKEDCDLGQYQMQEGSIRPALKTLADGEHLRLLCCDRRMRALFNGPAQTMQKGSLLTAYGGAKRDRIDYEIRNRNALPSTHVRRNGGNDTTQDGKPFADCFEECTEKFMDEQLALDVSERASIRVKKGVSHEMRHFLYNSGAGYFCNTRKGKAENNARAQTVMVDKVPFLVLVATRDILPFEEILCPYQNHDKTLY